MMYSTDCHCVVLEEQEFRDVLYYLDWLAETDEEDRLAEYRDYFHVIIR